MRRRFMVKKVLAGLFLGVLLSVQQPVLAVDWYYVGETYDNDQFFIDNDSVIKDESYADVWVKINIEDGYYLLQHIRLDRANRYMTVLETRVFDPNNRLEETDTEVETDNIEPGTMAEAVYDLIW